MHHQKERFCLSISFAQFLTHDTTTDQQEVPEALQMVRRDLFFTTTTNHQPTINQPSTNHQHLVHQPTINQPSTNHQPTINQPSTNHQPTINQPSTNHQPTINQQVPLVETCTCLGIEITTTLSFDEIIAPRVESGHKTVMSLAPFLSCPIMPMSSRWIVVQMVVLP
jgi:hypothetical protein